MNIDGKYLPFNQMTLEVFQSRMLLASSTPKFEGVIMNTNAFFVNKSAHKYPGFGFSVTVQTMRKNIIVLNSFINLVSKIIWNLAMKNNFSN